MFKKDLYEVYALPSFTVSLILCFILQIFCYRKAEPFHSLGDRLSRADSFEIEVLAQ